MIRTITKENNVPNGSAGMCGTYGLGGNELDALLVNDRTLMADTVRGMG